MQFLQYAGIGNKNLDTSFTHANLIGTKFAEKTHECM